MTYNGPTPRQGPNNLLNYPIVVTTADGHRQGWLGSSQPNTPFHLEFFASSRYATDGSGEAEVYLGSLEVTTDSQGQAAFEVPFSPPVDRPIVTATATDPLGNTSELSPRRHAPILTSPGPSARLVPGTPLVFSTATGNALTLSDPDAGPLDPVSNLTLSVTSGSLMLPEHRWPGGLGQRDRNAALSGGPLGAERGPGRSHLHGPTGISRQRHPHLECTARRRVAASGPARPFRRPVPGDQHD